MINARIALTRVSASRAANLCRVPAQRALISYSAARCAKDDTSTIDSYRLPSQTSINEWEFRYDFIPKTSEPKIPPVTPEAVKQDIAHEKRAKVERQMQQQEQASSVKAEANDAAVVHGGESVAAEPEFLHDRGSKPVDATLHIQRVPPKPANRDKYIQSSLNPEINQSDVVHLGEREVDHKVSPVQKPPVEEDHEHDGDHHAGQPKAESSGLSIPIAVPLGLAGALGAYFYFGLEDKASKAK